MDKRIRAYEDDGTTKKFQTLQTTTVAQSLSITANRILIISEFQANFIAFGSNPTATTSSFIIPAGAAMQFNFVSGQKVSAVAQSGTSYITIIDMD